LAIILNILVGWPSTFLAGLIVGMFYRTPGRAFIVAFLGTGCAWMFLALVSSLWSPSWLLTDKLIQITGLPSSYGFLMFIFTGIIGGILGGLGAANVVIISNLISKKEKLS
jgi:hypothetical protein